MADPFFNAVLSAFCYNGLTVADGIDSDAASSLRNLWEVELPVGGGGNSGAGAVEEQDGGSLA